MLRWLSSSAIVVGLAGFVAGCASSTSPSATVSSVTVSDPDTLIGPAGGVSRLTATATMTDGTTQWVTTLATWSSSNTAVATVSSQGA